MTGKGAPPPPATPAPLTDDERGILNAAYAILDRLAVADDVAPPGRPVQRARLNKLASEAKAAVGKFAAELAWAHRDGAA
jgi:hypothetical protein